MRRWLLALSVSVALPLALPAGAGANFLKGGCIDRDEPSIAAPRGGGGTEPDSFELRTVPGGEAEALRYRDLLRSKGAWSRFKSETGLDGLIPGQAAPARIYIQASGLFDVADTTTYCTGPTEIGIVARGGLPDQEATHAVVHESFHMFQSDAKGSLTEDAWTNEATAEWATAELGALPPDMVVNRDQIFTQKPRVPLTSTTNQHQYGAYRFIQWLDQRLAMSGNSTWKVIRSAYERIGAGLDPTAALDLDLKAHGVDMREELGAFWGDQLRETPRTAPQTRGRSRKMSLGTDDFSPSAPALAADVVRLKAPSGARRIVITAKRPPTGTYLWVLDGGAPVEWRDGGTAHFCVKGSEEGAVRWPGEFPLAFTNGKDAQKKHSFDITVDKDGCENKKPAPVKGPGGVLSSLPKRCPPAPPNFAAPPPRTRYWVFGERFVEVVNDLARWTNALNRRYPSRTQRVKAAAPWIQCAAKRARGIDAAPDEKLRLSALDYASRLNLAADGARRADIPWMIEHLNAAGEIAVLIAGRVGAQDQNPENARR